MTTFFVSQLINSFRLAVVTEDSMGEHSLNIVDLDTGKFLLPSSINLPGPVQATWKVFATLKIEHEPKAHRVLVEEKLEIVSMRCVPKIIFAI